MFHAYRVCVLLGCCSIALAGAASLELDERPAEPGDWGYRPETGAEPDGNPPGFSWRPSGNAAVYHLQIASDEAFEDMAYEKSDILWPAHRPSMTFSPGAYYWWYAALGEDGARTNWSTVRTFTVTAAAAEFPMPPTSELLERLPAGHPRLFFRPEDIPELRALARGPLEDRLEALVESVDNLLEDPPDTTEPPLYPEGVVRLSDEWREMWWGNRLHTIALTDGAATLAFVYRLTGDEKYGRAARDLLLAFAEWDPKGSTNYDYNDEAGMPALYYPSRAYTWVYPLLSDEDREKITGVMRIRGQDCFNHLRQRQHLWRPYGSHRNRAWHWLGELAIAFHGDFEETAMWLDYVMTILGTAYPVWSDSDGGWHEGTSYWLGYLRFFTYWADVVDAAFDFDVYQMPFFRNVGNFALYLMPPGTRHGGFGDLAPIRDSSNAAGLMRVFGAAADNPHWQWYAQEHDAGFGSGYVGFLRSTKAAEVTAKPPEGLPTSIHFRGVGLAVLNTNLLDGRDNVQIHFKSSREFGRQSHGYNSNNAFLLGIDGHPVFLRSGRRDVHGGPHHRGWMWHTQSDNAILVNGESQIKYSRDARGDIIAFHTSPAFDVVAGEAGDSYENLDSWKRRIVFFKPDKTLTHFVIHDRLIAPEPSSYQWMLHTKGAMTIDGSHVSWEGHPGRVDVAFLYPDQLSITQTDEYDPPPRWNVGEWHLTAEPSEKAAQQEFLTLVTVNGADVGVDTENSSFPRDVSLTWPSGTARVQFEDAAFTVTLPDAEPQTFTETR